MKEQEECVSQGDPEPIYFNEVGIQEVALECKIARCLSWKVGLRDGIVWRISCGGIDEGEQ